MAMLEGPDGRAQGIDIRNKLVIIGGTGVGKSALTLRFVKGHFPEFHGTTIGASFLTQTVKVDEKYYKFEIWDTAGQEQYHSVVPLYYRGAKAAIVAYDITCNDSYIRAKTWVNELQANTYPDIVIALAGNKVDLAKDRAVNYMEAEQFAEDNGLLFMETSAKTGENVNEIFLEIAKNLSKKNSFDQRQSICLTPENFKTKRGTKGCCK